MIAEERSMKWLYAGALAALLLRAVPVSTAFAACTNPKCTDATGIEKARGMIQSTCGCTREGQTHGKYSKCVKSTLKAANLTALIPQKPCRKLIMKCENASICGKLNAAVCCVVKKSGKVKSSIVKSATKCKKGTACGASLGFYSTFDACTADGTCVGPTTTTTTTSPPTTTFITATSSTTTSTTTTPTTLPPSCPLRESPGLPSQITLTVPLASRTNPATGNGSDLDNGWTGTSHNFPVIGGSSLKYCLTGCDGTTTFQCTGTGSTGAGGATGSLNGSTFGALLPLLAANVPVCVVNVYQDATLNGTFNLQTGDAGTAANPNLVRLNSMVYLRTTFPEVCPRCNVPGGGGGIGSVGKCSTTAQNSGADCRVDGEVTVAGKGLYLLSSACTPLGDSPPTTLDIQLPFTTGTATKTGSLPCPDSAGPQTQDDSCGTGSCTASCTGAACNAMNNGQCIDAKGGISQLCCSNSTSTPCFPTKNNGTISRTGSPGTDGQTLVSAATFCIARTNSTLINVTTGLPGPGAVLLPATVVVTRSP
jgi:hypothetical protein